MLAGRLQACTLPFGWRNLQSTNTGMCEYQQLPVGGQVAHPTVRTVQEKSVNSCQAHIIECCAGRRTQPTSTATTRSPQDRAAKLIYQAVPIAFATQHCQRQCSAPNLGKKSDT